MVVLPREVSIPMTPYSLALCRLKALHTSDIGYFLGLETPDTAGAEQGQLSLVSPLQQYW